MTHLVVAVRVRPLSLRETETHSTSTLVVENGKNIAITNIKVPEQNVGDSRERIRRFTFDYCFHENSSQDDVFQAVESVIGKAIRRRYHSCVLAYGQSSSGKTHTMMGFPHDPGVIPRLCRGIFTYLQDTAVGDEIGDFKIAVSYLEIYNEKVRDLLKSSERSCAKSENATPLKIRQHPKRGPYVQGLTEHIVSDSASLLQVLQAGNNNRRVAATLTNPQSSRSHSVFVLTFGGVKLTLVDLAGSERAESRCHSTSRFREGANINKSLVALGNVISCLADQTSKLSKGIRRRFIPFRDSVLTWLLKDTLGGNSKTVMIANISPSSTCYSETVNTLRFGQRAKLIVSSPIVNEDPKERTIRELREEIARLKELLSLSKFSAGRSMPTISRKSDQCSGDIDVNVLVETMSSSNSTEHLADSKLTSPASPVSETESKEQDLTRTSTESIIQESSEELIPLMDVVSVSETPKIKSPKPLKRTFSVDHGSSKMKSSTSSRKFGSQETIAQQPKKTLPSSSQLALRRQSVDKFSRSTRVAAPRKTSDPTIAKKTEKGIATESRPQLSKVESRVDSIRRVPPKPRSQIVAAVTSRLYAKTNKKDVGTDTLDMAVSEPTEVPKELTICSNARLRLKELTRRALKAHRSKHEETQTDLFPVMRLKETSTDVVDLKIELQEVRDVETSTNIVETDDKETTCALDGFAEDTNSKCQHFVVTRSCGTQSMCPDQMCPKDSPQTNLSFTKYLMSQTGTHSNSSPSQSVYTGSVNINICHNYINGHKGSDSVSDDSLDEHNSNVCFPTPDLISNHNSLETHAHATTAEVRDCFADRICHANHVTLQDQLEVTTEFLLECNSDLFTAKCSFTPEFEEILNSADIPCVCAPEICITASELLDQKCQSFSTIPPPPARPSIIETKTYSDDCVTIMEPVVLKSIMKNMPECSKDEDFPVPETEALDSLDYHMANAKKVHFTKSKTCRNEHMFKAMSGFLQEATTLMNNLTSAVSNLDSEYEVQVTVNDISGLGHRRKRKRKPSRCSDAISQTESTLTEDEYVQTQPAAEQHTNYTQCEDFELPHNKYELLLEDSVRRLEEKIDSYENNKNSYSFVAPPEEGQQPLLFNRWDGNDGEDTSLESTNMTCSDYGSLPRRLYRRCYRTPSSSPSALLRQLATMRRQVVDSSRNELHSDYKHFPHFFADDTE